MNIIELIKQIITDYPAIKEFTNKIHVDFTDGKNKNFGISSSGDSLISQDILGNQTRQHNFSLYAVSRSFNDYDRLNNSSFLLDLGYYLETISGNLVTATIGDKEKKGRLVEIKCSNAMMFNVPTGNIQDGMDYMIQIHAVYDLYESEEL